MELENLEVYKQAREFRKAMSSLSQSFPNHEKFELARQLVSASRSVSANIAEGYGRYHFQENIQFCRQGRGSLLECLDHLNCAFDEGYISEEELNTRKDQLHHVRKILNGYILYLKRRKGE